MVALAPSLSHENIPKRHALHLAWRAFVAGEMASERAPALVNAAKRNCLFHLNAFCWVYEPRTNPAVLPLNTYEFQDRVASDLVTRTLRSLDMGIVDENFTVVIEKSRTMGVTWICTAVADWFWRFHERVSMLVISKKEDDVDKRGDIKAVMPRFDFIEEHMPVCMQIRGNRHDQYHGRAHLLIYNPRTKSAITGESSNPNAGRGGRYTFVLRDEEASAENGEQISGSLNQTTRCVWRVSTPNGVNNSFFRARRNPSFKIHTLHWTEHPIYRRGLYEWDGRELKVRDQKWHDAYQKKHHRPYPFQLRDTSADPGTPWNTFRSPWFDTYEAAAESRKEIAQEVQISYLGSGSPWFDPARLGRAKNTNTRAPLWKGDIQDLGFDVLDADVRPHRAKSWFQIIGKRPPQNTTYTIAIDISTGTGASDSVIAVGDDTTKEKVFTWKTNGVLPEALAMVTRDIYQWFTTPMGKPFLAWDAGGPGMPFGARILQLGNMQVYYHKADDERKSKTAKRPGVHLSGFAARLKIRLFTDIRAAIFGGWYNSPDEEFYAQASEYVYGGDRGIPTHERSSLIDDPSAKGEQHGDIAIAEIILYHAQQLRPAPEPLERSVPRYSYAWRLQQAEAREKAATATAGYW